MFVYVIDCDSIDCIDPGGPDGGASNMGERYRGKEFLLWRCEVDFVLGVTDPPAGGVGRSDTSDPRIWAEQGRSVGHIPPKNFRRAARGGSVGRTRPTKSTRDIRAN
jgi:hypothetical protein